MPHKPGMAQEARDMCRSELILSTDLMLPLKDSIKFDLIRSIKSANKSVSKKVKASIRACLHAPATK